MIHAFIPNLEHLTYLGNGLRFQFMLVSPGGVQSEAFAGTRASGSASSLIGRRLGDGHDVKVLDAVARVEGILLTKARIDHVGNAVDRHRRLRDVRRQNHLQRSHIKHEHQFIRSVNRGNSIAQKYSTFPPCKRNRRRGQLGACS